MRKLATRADMGPIRWAPGLGYLKNLEAADYYDRRTQRVALAQIVVGRPR
jgi:hypothetical protein